MRIVGYGELCQGSEVKQLPIKAFRIILPITVKYIVQNYRFYLYGLS